MQRRISNKFNPVLRVLQCEWKLRAKSSLLLLIVLLSGSSVMSQSQWLDHGNGSSVSLEIYKPFIPTYRGSFVIPGVKPEYTAGSSTYFLSGRYEVNKELTVVADLPMVYGKWDDTVEIDNEGGFKIGNPYLGIEYMIKNSDATVEFGFRIPVTTDDKVQATTYGLLSDIDRVEAFLPYVVPFTGAVSYRTVTDSKILIGVRVGAELWFNTKKLGLDKQPVFSAAYALQTGYLLKDVHFIFGLSGKYDLDSSPEFPEKLNLIEYGLLVTFPMKNIRPAFSIKVPGENLGKRLNYVIGLNCTYVI